MGNADIRALITGLVAGVRPADAREADDQAGILTWIGSGPEIFRVIPPATPPRHLVSYFALVDSVRLRARRAREGGRQGRPPSFGAVSG